MLGGYFEAPGYLGGEEECVLCADTAPPVGENPVIIMMR